ncbi:MAG TPA: sulfite exporter TauE/SafE family protein [Pyrinomonadaceae bacterium]|nr:sulfite exporter TauE/SafE family protein [Pyrinomonadaceae bacterium]
MFTVLFFLIALLSEIVGTVAGFGSSVFFVPLASFFFDFHQVLALTSILHVFSNAAKLVLFGKHVRLRLLLLLGIPSVAAVILGAYLSTKLELKFDQLILGLFLITFSMFFLWNPTAKVSATKLTAISAGGVAGFMAGLIGTGGALRGLALAAFDLEKGVFVATSAGIDSGVDFSRMIIYLRSGYLAPNSLVYIIGLLIIAFVGSYLGKLTLGRIDQKYFRKIVLGFVLLIGLITLGRAINDLIR